MKLKEVIHLMVVAFMKRVMPPHTSWPLCVPPGGWWSDHPVSTCTYMFMYMCPTRWVVTTRAGRQCKAGDHKRWLPLNQHPGIRLIALQCSSSKTSFFCTWYSGIPQYSSGPCMVKSWSFAVAILMCLIISCRVAFILSKGRVQKLKIYFV